MTPKTKTTMEKMLIKGRLFEQCTITIPSCDLVDLHIWLKLAKERAKCGWNNSASIFLRKYLAKEILSLPKERNRPLLRKFGATGP